MTNVQLKKKPQSTYIPNLVGEVFFSKLFCKICKLTTHQEKTGPLDNLQTTQLHNINMKAQQFSDHFDLLNINVCPFDLDYSQGKGKN